MDRVEEGVSNFRAFQLEGRAFFDRADERAKMLLDFQDKQDKKDAQRDARINILIAFVALLIGILTWLGVHLTISGRLATL
jgi:hypothetical protein